MCPAPPACEFEFHEFSGLALGPRLISAILECAILQEVFTFPIVKRADRFALLAGTWMCERRVARRSDVSAGPARARAIPLWNWRLLRLAYAESCTVANGRERVARARRGPEGRRFSTVSGGSGDGCEFRALRARVGAGWVWSRAHGASRGRRWGGMGAWALWG